MVRKTLSRIGFLGAMLAAPAAMAQQGTAPAAGTAPAVAPVSSDPMATTATFGDWVLRCQKSDAQPQRVCEVAQTLQAQNQATIAQIAIGRLSAKEPLRLTVILPPNVIFPSSVRMSVDEKDTQPADLAWRRCLGGGCIADVEIRDDIVRRWRLQTERGRMQFKDSSGRDVVLPFSYRGLAQALDAMAKS